MFTATFFFLGLATCLFAGLVCFALSRSLRAANTAHTIQPSPDEKAAWERLKKALIELHTRYEGVETVREKTLRSWVGTLVICAGLCMIGILLETRYDSVINVKSVVSGLVGGQQHVSIDVPAPGSEGHLTQPQHQEAKADKSTHATANSSKQSGVTPGTNAKVNSKANSGTTNSNTNSAKSTPTTNTKTNSNSTTKSNTNTGTNPKSNVKTDSSSKAS